MGSCLSGCLRTSQPRVVKGPSFDPLLAASAPPPPGHLDVFRPPTSAPVATVIVPGTEDPAAAMARGAVEVQWRNRGSVATVRQFREKPARQICDESLALPTLYLQFLDPQFLLGSGEIDWALRAGNDNEEVRVVLPEGYMSDYYVLGNRVGGKLGEHLAMVLRFLISQGDVPVSTAESRAGSFGPKGNYKLVSSPRRLSFSLKASRPKASISLDKAAFGIPTDYTEKRSRHASTLCQVRPTICCCSLTS